MGEVLRRHAYMRISMYTLTIALHVGNMWYLNTRFQSCAEVTDDPYLPVFASLQARFFTCWTFFIQVAYACVGLLCDILLLKNFRQYNYSLPKHLRGFRDTLFSAVVWPSTCVVLSVFWIIYSYDRSLIYPAFVDKILTSTSNHIMHTAIVPIALWEILFQPRSLPRSHTRNIFHLILHFGLYMAVLLYTYVERDVWLYPIFRVAYGTIYFPLITLVILSAALMFYYGQWQITKIVWLRKLKKKQM